MNELQAAKSLGGVKGKRKKLIWNGWPSYLGGFQQPFQQTLVWKKNLFLGVPIMELIIIWDRLEPLIRPLPMKVTVLEILELLRKPSWRLVWLMFESTKTANGYAVLSHIYNSNVSNYKSSVMCDKIRVFYCKDYLSYPVSSSKYPVLFHLGSSM